MVSPATSVKVEELDEEHERCEAALNALAEKRDAASLAAVLSEYEAHFAHEEAPEEICLRILYVT